MQSDGKPSEARRLYTAASVSYFLAVVGVSLRTYVRQRIVGKLSPDDWLMVISLAVYTMYLSFVMVGLHYGTGRHHLDLAPASVVMAVRYWYFCEWAYVITMTIIKVAIGIFYLRLTISRWQRLVVLTVMYGVVIFGIVYFGCVVVQCYPVPFIWERFSPQSPTSLNYDPMSGPPPKGNCLPDAVVVWGTYLHSILSAASDWTLSLLPIAMLWKVKLGWGTKLMVAGLLGMGALASTSTLVRLAYIRHIDEMGDFLWKTIDIAIWSTIEPGFALFAAGLATLRPLLRTLFPQNFRNLHIPSTLTRSFGDFTSHLDEDSAHKPSVPTDTPEPLKQPNISTRPRLRSDPLESEVPSGGFYTRDSIMSGKSRDVVIRLDAPSLFSSNTQITPALPSPNDSIRTIPNSIMSAQSREIQFGITSSQLPTGYASVAGSRNASAIIPATLAPSKPPVTPLPLPPLGLLTSKRFEGLELNKARRKERERKNEKRKSWKRIAGVLDAGKISEESAASGSEEKSESDGRRGGLQLEARKASKTPVHASNAGESSAPSPALTTPMSLMSPSSVLQTWKRISKLLDDGKELDSDNETEQAVKFTGEKDGGERQP